MVAVVGAVLVAAGAFLLVRPLSALVVLVVALAAELIAWAMLALRADHRSPVRWVFAGLCTLAAVAGLVFLPAVVVALPVIAAGIFALSGSLLIVRAVRGDGERADGKRGEEKRSGVATRVISVAFAVVNLIAAWLVWEWPDAATIVIAALFALALVVAGVWLIARAIRSARAAGTGTAVRAARAPGTPRERKPRLVLRGTAAALALLVTGAGVFGTVKLTGGADHADDFYSWQGKVPTEPGKVLRVAPYDGEVPQGAKALKVLYSTTYSDGSPALASAVVAFPAAGNTATAPRDVLAWQHGTTGVAQDCGPSVGTGALTEYAIPGISRAIERGWVVVATDYPGQGTAGRYPYLIGEGEGRATLDGIRAAQHIDEANASKNAWIWGHSQGGHATLWAGEIAGEYAPELNVLGVAALSAAADPLALAEKITGKGSGPVVDLITSFVLVPYADEYADVTLDSSVHPAGHGLVRAFAGRCATAPATLVTVLSGLALGTDTPLYTIDLTAGPTRDRLAQNIATGLVPAPLFLGQGVDDEVIPIETQRALNAKLCAADRVVSTHEYPGRTHMGVIAEGAPLIDDLYSWADRVAAGEQPKNC